MKSYFSPCRFALKRIKIELALAFVLLAAGCATHEKETGQPPLIQADPEKL
jgi:hypothetical protein